MNKLPGNNPSPNFDWEDILHYMKLSPKQKLDYLERLLRFFDQITPKQSKENWEKLKKLGF